MMVDVPRHLLKLSISKIEYAIDRVKNLPGESCELVILKRLIHLDLVEALGPLRDAITRPEGSE